LGLVLLTKLSKSEVDYARNHGTMPAFGWGVIAHQVNRLAGLGKNSFAKASSFTSPGQAKLQSAGPSLTPPLLQNRA